MRYVLWGNRGIAGGSLSVADGPNVFVDGNSGNIEDLNTGPLTQTTTLLNAMNTSTAPAAVDIIVVKSIYC